MSDISRFVDLLLPCDVLWAVAVRQVFQFIINDAGN